MKKDNLLEVGFNILDRVDDTVLDHKPLLDKTGQFDTELWTNFRVDYVTGKTAQVLQPGQYLPLWQRKSPGATAWAICTPAQVSTYSALVSGQRYMVYGGNKKRASHPFITDWNDECPYTGRDAELRHPGGFRRMRIESNIPALFGNGASFSNRPLQANKFHAQFQNADLKMGCPLELIARVDYCQDSLDFATHAMWDVLRNEKSTGYGLPFPIILSDEEEKVLHDVPGAWRTALAALTSMYSLSEVGILYKGPVTTNISAELVSEVYRNTIGSEERRGFATLDFQLYERMAQFDGATIDPEFVLTQ